MAIMPASRPRIPILIVAVSPSRSPRYSQQRFQPQVALRMRIIKATGVVTDHHAQQRAKVLAKHLGNGAVDDVCDQPPFAAPEAVGQNRREGSDQYSPTFSNFRVA